MAIITDDLLHYPEVLHYAVVKVSAAQPKLEMSASRSNSTTKPEEDKLPQVKPNRALFPARFGHCFVVVFT